MNITWDISSRCNLRCKHCGEWPYMDKSIELNKGDILIIAKNIAKIASHVTLLGGEPLLVSPLEEVCDIFQENNVSVDFITNGQIYNARIEAILSKKNVQSIYVSIDGMEEDNDEVRGSGSWNKATTFLSKIRNWNHPYKFLGVSTVLTKKSIQHLEEFLTFFEKENLVDAISFNMLDISGNALKFKSELQLSDNEIVSVCERIAKMSHNVKYEVLISTGCPGMDTYLRNVCGYVQPAEEKSCDALYGSGFCNMEGIFLPCRSYRGSGINLKKDIDWNQEYNIFNEFLEKSILQEQPNNSEGLTWCPLVGFKHTSLNSFANELVINLPHPNYRLNQQLIFFESSERYFILFCRQSEYVEYTVEGFEIYKLLYEGLATDEISTRIGIPPSVVWSFLDSETQKEHIAVVTEK